MAQFNTPDTIKEINDKMQADVSIETEGEALKVDSDKTMIGALASRIFDLYRKRLNINRQAFINTCDDEYLPVHG